jgi:hypothetical protein
VPAVREEFPLFRVTHPLAHTQYQWTEWILKPRRYLLVFLK